MSSSIPSSVLKSFYEQMLLTRLVDEHVCQLYAGEQTTTFVSCRGYEAAQIGTAVCIEVGQDFTLPCARDLGVLMAIGMTPYEVFCTHLNNLKDGNQGNGHGQVQWSYQKHNTVTGSVPAATQILHAAGIAFASKLRKVPVVTIAYCGDDVVAETDFMEGVRFSAQHHLPIIFICEHNYGDTLSSTTSCLTADVLPENIIHKYINGTDVLRVYKTMKDAVHYARDGHGPVLLEVFISDTSSSYSDKKDSHDPLVRCKHILQAQDEWDEHSAAQLRKRLLSEIEQAMQDAIRDTQ